MKVYFIPGLGADKRVFKHIQLPEGFEMIHLDWIKPEKKEKLRDYAIRMSAAIDQQSNWSLIGLSFGGMLATEISRELHPSRTILISSLPHSAQLPPYFKAIAPLQLHRIIPMKLFQQASVARRIFTTETNEDKMLLNKIIRESDPEFIKWALGSILSWRSENVPGGIIHIHGSKDHLLPIRYLRPTHTIEAAGHLMVMNRSQEVNTILREIFAA